METTTIEEIKTESYLTSESIFALARQLADGYTQKKMSEELSLVLGKKVGQSSISKMLKGQTEFIKLAMAWIECTWPYMPAISFDRDQEKEPVRYYKVNGPEISTT